MRLLMTRSGRRFVVPGMLLLWASVHAVADPPSRQAERYLFVWAGDQARKSADFLAVVDFDANSRDYGKLITTVALPNPGDTGNEPHHVGLSSDGRVLG